MRGRLEWRVTFRSITMSMIFAISLCIGIVGLWVLADVTTPVSSSPPEKGLHLFLKISGYDWELSYETNQSLNNTAHLLLLEGARTNHIPVSWENWTLPSDTIFVVSISDDVNGEGGRWWQYWINDRYGEVDAGHANLNDGDVVEWRFVPFPP